MDLTDNSIDRRVFLASLGSTVAGTAIGMRALGQSAPRVSPFESVKAVALDGFAVFDATALNRTVDEILPGRARDVVTAWRSRMFDYQWLRTLGGRYADFERTSGDALRYTEQQLDLHLSDADRARLLEAQLTLTPWADSVAAIRSLRQAGLRLVFLSNMTERMLTEGATRAGMLDQFEHVLSTDRIRAAKPDVRAYTLATQVLKLKARDIAFVAFAGWDAAGAAWFGYPTIWTNRTNAPADVLDAPPVRVCRTLAEAALALTATASAR